MSIFVASSVACPGCGQATEFRVVYSVNADRRPDLRQQILDGSFQRETCEGCGKSFRLEPEMTYLDAARGQWILVKPLSGLVDWPELEEQARTTFDKAYGPNTPGVARELGERVQARVTFGWPALHEKLLAAELGLDDVALELTKLSLIRGLEQTPLGDGRELRLANAGKDSLQLSWIEAANAKPLEHLEVPRALCDDIAASADWQPLRSQLEAGAFVDIHRLLVEPGDQDA